VESAVRPGNRTGRVDGLGTHTYDYDNLYRITNADYPGADETDYTYDAVGNRKTMVTGAGTTTYAYDAADRITSVTPPGAGAILYTFDDNGNLTDRGSDDFVWDAEDRLTSATVNSVTTTFTYNGDGLRDSLTTGGNTTTFTWDVNRGIPQVLDDEDLRYVYGIGRIAQVDGAGTYYYLSDGLGSTIALTDEAGDVVNDYDYDVFGEVCATSGAQQNEFQFTGEQVDSSTELEYLRARYYDAATGRFVSEDPFPGITGLPLSQNGYIYALNSPVNLLDPSGLCAFGLPCPDPIKKAEKAISQAVDAVGDQLADAFGPPYDLSKIIQRADIVPLAEVCALGGIPFGIVGVATGYVACSTIEAGIGVASLYVGQMQVVNSPCSTPRKLAATALNITNFLVDFNPLSKTVPFAGEVVEAGLYTASTAVLDCSATPRKNAAPSGKE